MVGTKSTNCNPNNIFKTNITESIDQNRITANLNGYDTVKANASFEKQYLSESVEYFEDKHKIINHSDKIEKRNRYNLP